MPPPAQYTQAQLLRDNTYYFQTDPKAMIPEERSTRGKKSAACSPSPPPSATRPSKILKHFRPHGPRKLRQEGMVQSKATLDAEVFMLGSSRTISPAGSRPIFSPRDAFSPGLVSGQNSLKVSWNSDAHQAAYEAAYEAASALFNMKTDRRRKAQRHETDILGSETRLYEEHNRKVTAAQTLMSIGRIDPPHGARAWKTTRFRHVLDRDNELEIFDEDTSEASNGGAEASDSSSVASILDVEGDRDGFRSTRVVWGI
ncbi:hypothetical protein E8E12_003413 [Didymella heteroderae]|uniref:Uncharacterized protein n=1 Tax=Didymella heteroderae TaxID=1769908 RepID=A0A9P5BYG5_9PLEO|nr:hypothetical protein E8E12_003413 [Didymella heteroderae]